MLNNYQTALRIHADSLSREVSLCHTVAECLGYALLPQAFSNYRPQLNNGS